MNCALRPPHAAPVRKETDSRCRYGRPVQPHYRHPPCFLPLPPPPPGCHSQRGAATLKPRSLRCAGSGSAGAAMGRRRGSPCMALWGNARPLKYPHRTGLTPLGLGCCKKSFYDSSPPDDALGHGAGRARPLVSAPPVRLPFILTVPHLIQRRALLQPGGAERAKHESQQELQEGRQQQRLLSQHDVGAQAAPGQKGRQKLCRSSPKSALGAPSPPTSKAEVGGRGQHPQQLSHEQRDTATPGRDRGCL